MKLAALICAILMSTALAFAQSAVVPWTDAATVIGKPSVIEGAVTAVTKSDEATLLHFGKPYKTMFTIVIFAINVPRWQGDLQTLYEGKTIQATGVVQMFRGRPEMVIADPAHLAVVTPGTGIAAAGATVTGAAAQTVGTNVAPTNTVLGPTEIGLLPFSIDVKRFTGARRGTGGGESYYGSAFRQRAFIELKLQNTGNQPITDISWQWVGVVISVAGGSDQYYHGTESNIELKPFETKVVRSDEMRMSGVTSLRQGMTSGTKMRGHFVKVFYKGQLVFKEASSPDLERDGEAYLEKMLRQTPRR
jgi:hypothetical protein